MKRADSDFTEYQAKDDNLISRKVAWIVAVIVLLAISIIWPNSHASAFSGTEENFSAVDYVFVIGQTTSMNRYDPLFARYDAISLMTSLCDENVSRVAIHLAYSNWSRSWPSKSELQPLQGDGFQKFQSEPLAYAKSHREGEADLTQPIIAGLQTLRERKNPAAAPVMMIIADSSCTIDMKDIRTLLTTVEKTEIVVHILYIMNSQENNDSLDLQKSLNEIASVTGGYSHAIYSADDFISKSIEIMAESMKAWPISLLSERIRAGGSINSKISASNSVAPYLYIIVDKIVEGDIGVSSIALRDSQNRVVIKSVSGNKAYEGNTCEVYRVKPNDSNFEWTLSAKAENEIGEGKQRILLLYDHSGLTLDAGLSQVTGLKNTDFTLFSSIKLNDENLPLAFYGDIKLKASIWFSGNRTTIGSNSNKREIDLIPLLENHSCAINFNDLQFSELGEYSVVVTAEGKGISLQSQKLSYKVNNEPPITLNDGKIDLSIVHPSIGEIDQKDEKSETIDISKLFSSPDGDLLKYGLSEYDEALISCELDGSNLLVSAKRKTGVSDIIVTAEDMYGAKCNATVKVQIDALPLSDGLEEYAKIGLIINDESFLPDSNLDIRLELLNSYSGEVYTDPECFSALHAVGLSVVHANGLVEQIDRMITNDAAYAWQYFIKPDWDRYSFIVEANAGHKKLKQRSPIYGVHEPEEIFIHNKHAMYTGKMPIISIDLKNEIPDYDGLSLEYDFINSNKSVINTYDSDGLLIIDPQGLEGNANIKVIGRIGDENRVISFIPVVVKEKELSESLFELAEFDIEILPVNQNSERIEDLKFTIRLKNKFSHHIYTDPSCYDVLKDIMISVKPAGADVKLLNHIRQDDLPYFEGTFQSGTKPDTYTFFVNGFAGNALLPEAQQVFSVKEGYHIPIEHVKAGNTGPQKIASINFADVVDNSEMKELEYEYSYIDKTLAVFVLNGDVLTVTPQGRNGSTQVTVVGKADDGTKLISVFPLIIKESSLAASLASYAKPELLFPSNITASDRLAKVPFAVVLKNSMDNTIYTDPECYSVIEAANFSLIRTGSVIDSKPFIAEWSYTPAGSKEDHKEDPYQDGTDLLEVNLSRQEAQPQIQGVVQLGKMSGEYRLSCTLTLGGKDIPATNEPVVTITNQPPQPTDEAEMKLALAIPPKKIPENWLFKAFIFDAFLVDSKDKQDNPLIFKHDITFELDKLFSDADGGDELEYSYKVIPEYDPLLISNDTNNGLLNIRFFHEGDWTIRVTAKDYDGEIAFKDIALSLTAINVPVWKTILVYIGLLILVFFIIRQFFRLIIWPFKPSWNQVPNLEVFINEVYEGTVQMPRIGKKPFRYGKIKAKINTENEIEGLKKRNPLIALLETAPLVDTEAKSVFRGVLDRMVFAPGRKHTLIIWLHKVMPFGHSHRHEKIDFYLNESKKTKKRKIHFRKGEFLIAFNKGDGRRESVSFLFREQ